MTPTHLTEKQQDKYETFLVNTNRYTSLLALQKQMRSFGMVAEGDVKLLKYKVQTFKANLDTMLRDAFAHATHTRIDAGKYQFGHYTHYRIPKHELLLYCLNLAVLDGVAPQFLYDLLRLVPVTGHRSVELTVMKYRKLERYVMDKLPEVIGFLRAVCLHYRSRMGVWEFLFDDNQPLLPGLRMPMQQQCRAVFHHLSFSAQHRLTYFDEFGYQLNPSILARREPMPLDPVVSNHFRLRKLEELLS